jgi:uncharacterized protein YjcR
MGSLKDFVKGMNPREHLSRHGERGPKRFSYTYDDLAEAFDVKPRTLRSWVHSGKLDPADIADVCRFYRDRARRAEAKRS